jgi:hypothetical protein
VHNNIDLSAVLGVIVGAALACAVIVLVGVRMQRRIFAGEPLDQWQRARRKLSFADQWRVTWATARRRPTDRAELAPAQVACARFRQDAAERSPLMRRRWARIALPAAYCLPALVYLVAAFIEHGQQRVFSIAMAVLFAAIGVGWAFLIPRSLRRLPDQMTRLRSRIEDRYANAS